MNLCRLMLEALLVIISIVLSEASQDANRLLEDLFMRYNRLIRPVRHPSDAVQIQFKLKLLQIITVVSSSFVDHKANRAARSL